MGLVLGDRLHTPPVAPVQYLFWSTLMSAGTSLKMTRPTTLWIREGIYMLERCPTRSLSHHMERINWSWANSASLTSRVMPLISALFSRFVSSPNISGIILVQLSMQWTGFDEFQRLYHTFSSCALHATRRTLRWFCRGANRLGMDTGNLPTSSKKEKTTSDLLLHFVFVLYPLLFRFPFLRCSILILAPAKQFPNQPRCGMLRRGVRVGVGVCVCVPACITSEQI